MIAMRRKPKGAQEKAGTYLFKRRPQTEYLTRQGVLDELYKAGVSLEPALLRFMRLPARMVRGTHEALEFFDPLSVQPYPMEEKDSPPRRFKKGAKPPQWVGQRYLSLTEKGKKKLITFIDVPRGVFLQGTPDKQDEISNILYRKLTRADRDQSSGDAPA